MIDKLHAAGQWRLQKGGTEVVNVIGGAASTGLRLDLPRLTSTSRTKAVEIHLH